MWFNIEVNFLGDPSLNWLEPLELGERVKVKEKEKECVCEWDGLDGNYVA